MTDLMAQSETELAKIAAIKNCTEEATKVATTMLSRSRHESYAPVIASVNTLQKDVAICRCVNTVFIEENNRLKVLQLTENRRLVNKNDQLASLMKRSNRN